MADSVVVEAASAERPLGKGLKGSAIGLLSSAIIGLAGHTWTALAGAIQMVTAPELARG
jgi:hypothetical protein